VLSGNGAATRQDGEADQLPFFVRV
jgi:hypothetical protein